MTNLHQLDAKLDPAALSCRAVVETPRGHRAKYTYDPASELFALSGLLPAGLAFPLAFGFVPGTLADDGDPIDVLVLAEEDLAVGTLATVRLIGVMEAEQSEKGKTVRNDRLIARPLQSRVYADIDDLDCVGGALFDELERFFVTYNELKGKRFAVKAMSGPERAATLVAEAVRQRAEAR